MIHEGPKCHTPGGFRSQEYLAEIMNALAEYLYCTEICPYDTQKFSQCIQSSYLSKVRPTSVQFVQLPTFHTKRTANAQCLTYMRFNLLDNVFIHFEVMASEGLKEVGQCGQ